MIPAYNAEDTITKVVLDTIDNVDSILVCNDGSTDNTRRILEYLCKDERISLFNHDMNRGKGRALKTLFKNAKCLQSNAYVTLDSDGQHNPKEIPQLVKPILEGIADVVIGVRSVSDIPLYRLIGIRILDAIAGDEETQGGFRAYNQNALNEIELTKEGFSVDTEILDILKKKGMRIVPVPISVKYDEYSHSKNPIIHFLEVLQYLFQRRP